MEDKESVNNKITEDTQSIEESLEKEKDQEETPVEKESESIKTSFSKEKEKFSKMDFQQKVQYFKDYYLIKLLIVLAIVGVVVWLAHDILQNKKMIYAGAGVSVNITDDGEDFLTDGFIRYLGDDYSKKTASYGGNVLLVPSSGDVNENSVETAFISQVQTDFFQYLFFTEKKYEYFSSFEFFLDLSTLSNFSKYSESGVLTSPSGKPEAIKLPESAKEKIGVREEEDIYLCFVGIKDHKELNEKMLDYLFS